jgi:hypothetical protein
MAIVPQANEVYVKQYSTDSPDSIRQRLEVVRGWGVDQVVVETMDIAKVAANLGLKVVLAKSFFEPVSTGGNKLTKPTVELYFKKYDNDTPDAIANRLKMAQQWGVDQVVVQTIDVAQAADSLGLKVALANWWSVETPDSQIVAAAQAAASIKNITDVKMDDEPVYWQGLAEQNAAVTGQPFVPQYTPQRFQQLRDLFTKNWPSSRTHPSLSISFYGPEDNWTQGQQQYFVDCLATVDLLRLNMYPYDDPNELRQIWDWLQNAQGYLQQARVKIPIITTLQAWSCRQNRNGQFLMPSAAELRVMGYQALLAGCQAVSFYRLEPDTWANVPGVMLPQPVGSTPKPLASFTESMAALFGELASAATELADATVDVCMTPEGLLRAHVVNSKNNWIVNVNTSHQPYLKGTDSQGMIGGLAVEWFPMH